MLCCVVLSVVRCGVVCCVVFFMRCYTLGKVIEIGNDSEFVYHWTLQLLWILATMYQAAINR